MPVRQLLLLAPLFALALQAAPKLRLTSTTVGPVSATQGQNPPAQVVEAFNAGDGALALQFSSTATWVTASAGAARQCSQRAGSCIPVSFAFNSAALAAGTQTAVVTVNDPNALDAPQTVTVTIQVGGGVPNRVSLFVPPNGSDTEAPFSTNSNLVGNATTQSGGNWLTLTLDGTGSFRFVFPYRIRARHLEGMPEGTYNGQLAISGSSIPAENKTVPVTLQVTSQPIVRVFPDQVNFRVAQGASDQQAFVSAVNGGLGTLAVSGVSVTTSSGGEWLAAERAPGSNSIALTAKMANLNPGTYNATVSIASNGVNGAQTVPVRLDVVAQGPPVAAVEGVRNSGAFDVQVAPGGVAAIFGEQFLFEAPKSTTEVPLPTEIGGVRVLVNDRAAPLYFVSYNQINFQIPFETPPGEAVVRVERGGARGNAISVPVAERAPRIIRTGIGESGVIVTQDDGLAIPGGPAARPGEAITIYCVGFGLTDANLASGAAAPAAEPLARVRSVPRVVFGNPFTTTTTADPFYIGLTPSLVGLYQVNVIVPPDVAQGDIFVRLEGDGYESNRVIVPIRQ
ncbi:MAG: hypothetical protein SFV51_23015 [Bryobacteraceae bacterium]|nr:hypothetical protein [Bryobacteraceae bacterium]